MTTTSVSDVQQAATDIAAPAPLDAARTEQPTPRVEEGSAAAGEESPTSTTAATATAETPAAVLTVDEQVMETTAKTESAAMAPSEATNDAVSATQPDGPPTKQNLAPEGQSSIAAVDKQSGASLPAPQEAPALSTGEKSANAPGSQSFTSSVRENRQPAPLQAGISKQALAKLIPTSRRTMQILSQSTSITLGQDPTLYFELLSFAAEEWRPSSFQDCSLVKQIVDAQWELLLHQELQTCLSNFVLTNSPLAKIIDRQVEQKHSGDGTTPSLAARQGTALLRTAFAATAGDEEAIKFESYIRAYDFSDRAINTRISRRDSGLRQLQTSRSERSKRYDENRLTVEDVRAALPISEYARLVGMRPDEILKLTVDSVK